jgi:arylsulfatase A-like enzyme
MSEPLIETGRLTVAGMLQGAGYHTACIGKWHLGMEWPLFEGKPGFSDQVEKGLAAGVVDFSKPIRRGPNAAGFDTFFGISGSLDMVPYTFIENDRVVALPTVQKSFPMMPGKLGSTREGPAAADFEATDVLPTLTRQAVEYIRGRADAKQREQPFFLYLPLTAPHTPIAPAAEWRGKSGLNPYADFVMQVDATVGTVVRAIDEAGFGKETLLIFTSDNGCSPRAVLGHLREKGHDPVAGQRGHKADIFEGGHRVPFIARWPGKIPAGSTSEQIICLNDFMATCAELAGAQLPANAAEDSVSLLPVLQGKVTAAVHEAVVHHSINGSFAIRQGNWKLALCAGSGGWSKPSPGSPEEVALPPDQLYDLERDPGEQQNLAAKHPEVVERLRKILERYIAEGRSTPGPKQANTGVIQLRKSGAK